MHSNMLKQNEGSKHKRGLHFQRTHNTNNYEISLSINKCTKII